MCNNNNLLFFSSFLIGSGNGKSLTYQLPALMTKGVTIVIVLLLAIMYVQVPKLQALGIKAHYLCGNTDNNPQSAIYEATIRNDLRSENPTIKLLFISPEKLLLSSWVFDILEILHSNDNFARLIVDEPMSALTATATTAIKAEIVAMIQTELFLILRVPAAIKCLKR